jgi:hypothetical protein
MGADRTEQAQITTIGIDHVGLTVLALEVVLLRVPGLESRRGNPSYPAAFVSDSHQHGGDRSIIAFLMLTWRPARQQGMLSWSTLREETSLPGRWRW